MGQRPAQFSHRIFNGFLELKGDRDVDVWMDYRLAGNVGLTPAAGWACREFDISSGLDDQTLSRIALVQRRMVC